MSHPVYSILLQELELTNTLNLLLQVNSNIVLK